MNKIINDFKITDSEILNAQSSFYKDVINFSNYNKKIPKKDLTIRKLLAKKEHNYDINEILISSSVKQALSSSLLGMLNSGDEVIVVEPFSVEYINLIKLLGFKVITTNPKKINFTDKTKAIIVFNPNQFTSKLYQNYSKFIDESCYLISIELSDLFNYSTKKTLSKLISKNRNFITIKSLNEQYKNSNIEVSYVLSTSRNISLISNTNKVLGSTPSLSVYKRLRLLIGRNLYRKYFSYYEILDLIKYHFDNLGIEYIEPDCGFTIAFKLDAKDKNITMRLLNEYKIIIISGKDYNVEGYFAISAINSRKNVSQGLKQLKLYHEETNQKK